MKDIFFLRFRLRIVGGVLNLFCIIGEVIGIKDLKMEEKLIKIEDFCKLWICFYFFLLNKY